MTGFEYYPNDLLWKITDDKGNTTEYKYDDQMRVTRVIYPDTTTLEYTYTEKTEDGKKYNMVIEKQRNGTVVTTIYDEMNRINSRSIEPGPGIEGVTSESYQYDGLSRLTHAENDYSTVDMKYDPLNRVIEENQNGKVITYSYRVENGLRKMTVKYPNQRIIERDFDLLDRISKIKEDQENIVDYSYIGRSYRVLSQQFGNGDAVSYLYDQGRRLAMKESKNKNSDLINKYIYGYNKVHMKMYEQRLHDSGKGNVMRYDALYRLTNMKFNVPDPTVENPTEFEICKDIYHDSLDNILKIVENFNGQINTITTDIPTESDYTKLNQYSHFGGWGLTYDKNGNTIQKGTLQLSYDSSNQLVTAAEATTNTQVDMRYDVLGRRIQKRVTKGSEQKIENYYYSGHQLIEVRDGNGQVLRQYIYGYGIDEIIRMDRYENGIVTYYYYHPDANGSVTAITDANGQLVERGGYDIYGMPFFWDAAGNIIPKSSIGNNILFHGREYDPELNLYYFRARYYDPIMGRFLQTDPMGYQDSLNLYQGFNMNPYNFTDPFGLVIHEWEHLGVYGPASWRPDKPVPYQLFTYDESGAYARFKDSIKIEPVQRPDGRWTIRASFKMTVLIWLTHKHKLEHEKAHIVQYMNLYMEILRQLEHIEKVADDKPYETKEAAQKAIDRMAGKDYSKIKNMKINVYPVPSVHDKKTRKRVNEIIDETNYFEMKKTTDPPFKVRKFEVPKTFLDYILGIKDEK
ncbi:MAG: hypothetical protein JSV88_33770 [Candidatus Aminicenantes bacterium]|nr:MAG: hypothetical protein JSV88_33770 [Candidatus Aminicenantes bacterium]